MFARVASAGLGHVEPLVDRLRRFLDGGFEEIAGTVIVGLRNIAIPELEQLCLDQPNLVFLGTHAIVQIVAEKLLGMQPLVGTTFYLRNFVDQVAPDRQFSAIAADIHKWRNVVAHAWLQTLGHTTGVDASMLSGWERRGAVLWINPVVYRNCFTEGFNTRLLGSSQLAPFLSPEQRVDQTYGFLRGFLNLSKGDPIAASIKCLTGETDAAKRLATEATIKAALVTRYGL